jgi:hypothetical protein
MSESSIPDDRTQVPPPDAASESATAEAPAEPSPDQPDPEQLLRAFARQCKSAATAALEMGRLGAEYVTARMSLSEKVQRDACIRVLASKWQEHSDDTVTPARVNALIRTAAAWALFNAATGHKPGKVALRVVREFAPLCERDAEQRAEAWRITAALEERARALWAEATSKGLNGEEAAAAVAELLAAHDRERAAEAARVAAAEPDDPAARQQADDAAAQAESSTAKAAAKRGRVRPQAEDNPAPAGPAPSPKPTPEAQQGQNLLVQLGAAGKAGGTKQYAEFLAAAVARHGDPLALAHDLAGALLAGLSRKDRGPDDVLEALLRGLDRHPELSGKGRRAVQRALVVLAGKADGPAPADVAGALAAPANGRLAAAG